MTSYLLDTNVISEPSRARPDHGVVAWLDDQNEHTLFLSAFTFAEIRKGITKLSASDRRDRLEQWLSALRLRFSQRILPIGDNVLDRWGILTGTAEARGRKVPGIDALFAATALCHDLILVTRNTKDIAGTGVQVLNPWALWPDDSG